MRGVHQGEADAPGPRISPGRYLFQVMIVFMGWLMGSICSAAPQPDNLLMHHGGKASIPVLVNDMGTWQTSSLAIVTAPLSGMATVQPHGRILYAHTLGAPAQDQFAYQILDDQGQTSAATTVTISFSTQGRLPATTLQLPANAPTRVVEAFPGLTFGAPTSMESPPGETNRLYVTEKAGRIFVVTNLTEGSVGKIPFLDISARVTNDSSELGLKGLAFHPGYATNGLFFITYCHTQGTVRLSRFYCPPGSPTNLPSPESEVVFIEQPNEGQFHNIDDAVFGPDGYLYVGLGDEGGNQVDGYTNSQCIDKDFWSTILRLDVDKKPGSLAPNHHPAIVAPTNYAIPPDNPFIGATQFNGQAVNPAQVRTEFYAVGFRNPWQFSFDEQTGELWVGDVGNLMWEEVNVVTAGWNGGWAFYEGNHPGPRTPPPGFTYDPPVWEYPHDAGPFAGSAVTGGFVVRTNTYPDLYPAWRGKYLCADILSGHIWTVERTVQTTVVERIAGEGTIIQFARDPSNGTILMLDFDEGRIRRLLPDEVGGDTPFPQELSTAGIFADLTDLTPNPGVVPYSVNLTFWSDYAIKQRWFALTNLNDDIGFTEEGSWPAPPGMVWIKHFDLEQDRGNPATRQRIETRVLVRTTNGSYGVSYRWNESGTEADLVPDIGVNIDLAITNAGVPGVQHWRIPGRTECLICHNVGAGQALSFNSRQLNHSGELAGVSGNFIERMAEENYFSNAITDPRVLPRYVRPDESTYSREVRARSYLAVNCAYCHRGTESLQGNWDGRPELTLAECGLVRVPASINGGDTNNLLLVPGSVPHSIIWNRIAATNGFTRMPPLATSELDPAGIQLLADWISQDLPGWQTYAAWRAGHFGSTNSLAGEPTADPDEDGHDNTEEFLTYTQPTNGQSYWTGQIGITNGWVELNYQLYNRSVHVEKSTNLTEWATWNAFGNQGLPGASGQILRVTAPDVDAKAFYRFKVEER